MDDFDRRRSERLSRSLERPHPESLAMADAGIGDWGASCSDDDQGLVDLAAGEPVRWVEGRGWVSERQPR